VFLGLIVTAASLAVAPGAAAPRVHRAERGGQQTQTPPPTTTTPPQTSDAAAQGRGAGRENGAQRPGSVDLAKVQTVQDMLEGMEINRADKFLQVDDKHYGEFIQRLRNLQRLRRQHQNQRQRLVGELRKLTNPQLQPPVEDALLEAPTKKLDDFDRQALQETQDAYAKIDEVLTVRQRARFRVFEEMMEQQKLEILTRVLKSGAPAPSPAPGAASKPVAGRGGN
jgi:hypothetical protein